MRCPNDQTLARKPLPPEALEHLAECSECRGVVALSATNVAGKPLTESMFARAKRLSRPSRILRRPAKRAWWPAAVAAVAAVALIAIFISVAGPKPKPEPIPEKIAEKPESKPEPRPEPEPEPEKPEPKPEPEPEPEKPKPKPEPEKPEPKPENPEPEKPEPEKPKPTIPEPKQPVKRVVAAIAVLKGSLQIRDGKKWIRTEKLEEGTVARAGSNAKVRFAGAEVSLARNSEFSVEKGNLTLAGGDLSAEIPGGAPFAVVLAGRRIEPRGTGRILLRAKPDRIILDEGYALADGDVLGQGVEFQVKDGKMVPSRRRTLRPAVRPRELLTWNLDFQQDKLDSGKVERRPRGNVIRSDKDGIRYFAGGNVATFTVKKTTHVRFRYYTRNAKKVRFQIWNLTKGENFSIEFETVARHWTTVTLSIFDVPVNRKGKQVTCEESDQYGRFSFLVDGAEVLIDLFQVLEVER